MANQQTPDEMFADIIKLAEELDLAVAKGGDGTRAGMALTAACSKLTRSGETVDNAQAVKLMEALVRCSDDYGRKQIAVLMRERGGLAALKQCNLGDSTANCVLDALAAAPEEGARRRLAVALTEHQDKENLMGHIVKSMLVIPDKSFRMKVTGALRDEFGSNLLAHLTAHFERPQPTEQRQRTGESQLFILNGMYLKEADPEKKAQIGTKKKGVQAEVDKLAAELRSRKPAVMPLSAKLKMEFGDEPLPRDVSVIDAHGGTGEECELPKYKSDGDGDNSFEPPARKPAPPNQTTNRFEQSRKGGKVIVPEKVSWWQRIIPKRQKG